MGVISAMKNNICSSLLIFLSSVGMLCGNDALGETDSRPPPNEHLSKPAQQMMLNMARMPVFDPVAQYNSTRGAGIEPPARPMMQKIEGEYDVSPVQTNSTLSYWITSPQQTDASRVILFVHGGAYIFGDAGKMIELPLRLGRAAGMKVLSVNHRLAPENPWPAALNDCLDAHAWLIEQGYSPDSIAWVGISSGGGIVLSMANAAKQQDIPLPGAIYAMSAWADMTVSGDSYVVNNPLGQGPGKGSKIKALADMYVGDADPYEPTISPMYGDLGGLPPTLIDAGSRELFLSDSTRWARRATLAGVDVTLNIWDGMWHGFHIMPNIPEAQEVTEDGATFLKAHLTIN